VILQGSSYVDYQLVCAQFPRSGSGMFLNMPDEFRTFAINALAMLHSIRKFEKFLEVILGVAQAGAHEASPFTAITRYLADGSSLLVRLLGFRRKTA